ncbi:hypothetical protein, partial [Leifsonia aquatica]|uniref:hypothetical protein n=1 Tax=Leifsonia aquatica TaxID=144185 RepID=UPI0005BA78EA
MTFLLDGRVIPPTRLAGVPYWFTDQVGWYDTPQDKSPVNEKKQGHGAFAVAKSYREALAISLHVVVAAATEADMLAAVEDLTSIGFDGP